MNITKLLFSLFIISAVYPLCAEPVECLQYRDQETRISYYWPLPQDKGVIAEVEPLLLNQAKQDESSPCQGYVIRYEKEDSKLLLTITSNIFEGFMELAPGMYSPIMTSDQQEIDLSRSAVEWVQIKLKGRKPLLVCCTIVEDPEQRAPQPLP
ncbi:MAG: hypothetical protein Q7Q73_19850 [Verrucomicrobiota bacterium JB024]|nr:hypothetical protein [Verrucomicrobiota bacterium JB024]